LIDSCPNGCDIEWYYSGNSIFNNNSGENPKTFSYYCRNLSESKTGTVGAIVTDKLTGMNKNVSKTLIISCNASGGGMEP